MAERPDAEEWMAERRGRTPPLVLALVNGGAHGHCYGVDYVLDGLREVCGALRVIDWPEKPCLHLPPGAPRDECNIDSDAWWPRQPCDIREVVARADVVLIAHSLDPALQAQSAPILGLVPARTPIAALDMGDSVQDLGAHYAQLAGRPLAAYFKREVPLGAGGDAIPCPLTYPAHKVPQPLPVRRGGVFYHATAHGWTGPGLPRMVIANGLRALLPASQLDLQLTGSQGERLSPEAYHERMAQALVGVSWNGAANWDCNRLWENFAYGLAQVAERPRVKMPHPFVEGQHVLWADAAKDVPWRVAELLAHPAQARAMGELGRRHFLQYHCAAARARWVLDHLERRG